MKATMQEAPHAAIEAATKVNQAVRIATRDTDRFCGQQGDVNLMLRTGKPLVYTFDKRLSVSVPVGRGDLIAQGEDVQVAVGVGVGARHIVKGGKGVAVYAPSIRHVLIGPVIVVDEDCEALLWHPEHAHWRLPAGEYQVSYPRDCQQADLARQAD